MFTAAVLFALAFIFAMISNVSLYISIKNLRNDKKTHWENSQYYKELYEKEKNRNDSERVPLRSKCRCGHDAFMHDKRGCRVLVGLQSQYNCACMADRDMVLYTPEPMKRLEGIGNGFSIQLPGGRGRLHLSPRN